MITRSIILSAIFAQFALSQSCGYGSAYFDACGACCQTIGAAGCYGILDGPHAGEARCMLYPSGSVVATSTQYLSQSASAPYSAPYSSYYAAPSSSAVGCRSGEKPCGVGCIPLSYTCCPQQQGGCSPSDRCVVRTDGSDACCPIGETCSDAIYSSSFGAAPSIPAFPSSGLSAPSFPTPTGAGPSFGGSSFTAGPSPSQTIGASSAVKETHTARWLWQFLLGMLGLAFGL